MADSGWSGREKVMTSYLRFASKHKLHESKYKLYESKYMSQGMNYMSQSTNYMSKLHEGSRN
jgi:hypothetical protein